jgi:hypothetical protein
MFKLNIESTKDIHELHITFADGSHVISTNSSNRVASQQRDKVREVVEEPQKATRKPEAFLDLDADFGGVSQEIVKPPDIHAKERPVKVASELQNLDI